MNNFKTTSSDQNEITKLMDPASDQRLSDFIPVLHNLWESITIASEWINTIAFTLQWEHFRGNDNNVGNRQLFDKIRPLTNLLHKQNVDWKIDRIDVKTFYDFDYLSFIKQNFKDREDDDTTKWVKNVRCNRAKNRISFPENSTENDKTDNIYSFPYSNYEWYANKKAVTYIVTFKENYNDLSSEIKDTISSKE